MSQLFGHSSPLEQVRPGDGELAADAAPRPFPASNPEKALFRMDIRRSLELHRRLAITVAVVGIALTISYFFRSWPVYEANCLVYVSPSPGKVLDGGAQPFAFDGASYQSYIQQQMVDVTREDVLVGALHKLDPGSWQLSGESDQAAAERLSHIIEVNQNGSYQFTVGARAKNPELAAKLANAVTNSYVESTSREQKSGDAERVSILQAERDRVQKELTADRAEQEALNKELGVAGVGNYTPDFLDDDIGRTRAALVVARTNHDEAEAKFTAMDAGAGAASAAIDAQADEMAAADPGLTSMKTSLNQRRAAMLTQMANLTPSNPVYKQDAEELTKINASLDSMMKDLRVKAAGRIEESLRTDLERTSGVEDQLNGQLRQLVASAGGATAKLQRSSDLAADITRLQARYATVDEQMHNIMLDQVAPGAVYLAAAAVPPLHTAKSSVVRNAFLLVLASILLGIMTAVMAHKMDQKLYVASDVEHILGFAPMAQWPEFAEVSDEVAEEYVLRLAAAIEFAYKQGALHSCMFTGAGPGTGTSTLATRMCDTLEAMGRPTVLVDASGSEAPAPRNGQAASSRGGRSLALLQQLAEEARLQEESFVITDTAPLAVSAETEYLARFVDCAIVVVESGVTTRAQLRATANTLQKLDVASVGFVINRVKMDKADANFRNSVRAIENHLRYQKRSTGKRSMRSRHLAAESSTDAQPVEQKPAAQTQTESPRPQPAAEARTAEPVAPPVRSSAPAVPERAVAQQRPAASAAANPAPPARPGIKLPPPRLTPQSAPTADSEVPWWLSETAVTKPGVPAPDAPAVPVKARQAEIAPIVPPRAREAEIATARLREAELAAARQREVELAAARQREAEIASARRREAEIAAAEARQAQAEEDAHLGATRLSGLRNVLFSLGLNNLNKTRESEGQFVQPLPPREAVAQPAAQPVEYHRTFVPYTEPVAGEKSRLVTATPEFLPPQLEPKTAARRDRRDAYDEVEILPSWRGQYRRKD